MASASTALALPGASPALVQPQAAGLGKLEPRFIAMLQERGIPEAVMLKLAAAECLDVPIYGNIGIDKKDVEAFLLAAIDVDRS